MTIGLTILFVVVMLWGVRLLLAYIARRTQSSTFSIIVLLLAAYVTNAIGIHPIFGAFLAGIILPRNVAFTAQIRKMDQINNVLFLPLFFIFSGLQTQVGLIQGPGLWFICLLILALASLGKIAGGTFSSCVMGETWKEALCIGILMNTRGLVEFIVLNIGLQLGVLSPILFAMLVIMALITTMMASPILLLLGYRSRASTIEPEEAIKSGLP